MKTPKPSLKTLVSVCGNEPHLAKELRAILTEPRADVIARIASQLHHGFVESLPFARMLAMNTAGNFHGVEAMESTQGEYADFLNAGDTYAPTVIYWRGRFRVQSVGDFVETMERRSVHFK